MTSYTLTYILNVWLLQNRSVNGAGGSGIPKNRSYPRRVPIRNAVVLIGIGKDKVDLDERGNALLAVFF